MYLHIPEKAYLRSTGQRHVTMYFVNRHIWVKQNLRITVTVDKAHGYGWTLFLMVIEGTTYSNVCLII
jgi:hypothetical protein